MSIIDPIKSGDKILASTWDTLRRIAARFQWFSVDAPLELLQTPSGTHLRVNIPTEEIWAKITAGSNPYGWIEQIPEDKGTWKDGPRHGTNAYEVNKNTTVAAGTYVLLNLKFGMIYPLFVYSKCGS